MKILQLITFLVVLYLSAFAVVGETTGFWYGMLHGYIIIYTFLLSLFMDSISIYAGPSAGFAYAIGFWFTASISIIGFINSFFESKDKCKW